MSKPDIEILKDLPEEEILEDDDEEEEILEDEEEEESSPLNKSQRRRVMEEEDDDENDDDDEDDDNDEFTSEMNPTEKPLGTSNSMMNFAFDDMDDDDEEEEEEEDEQYLQKFDENLKKNVIQDHHPEMMVQNFDEIEVLSRVVRDQHGNVIDPLHQSVPFVTKYEKARILGERARQINAGAKPFVNVDVGIIDGYLIAHQEFLEKKIPYILKRPISGTHIEYWKLSDLEII